MGIASIEVKTNLYQGVLRRRFALISPSPVEIILPQVFNFQFFFFKKKLLNLFFPNLQNNIK